MSTTMSMEQLAQLIEEFRAATRLQAQFLAEPQTKVTNRGFMDVIVNLADLVGSGQPLQATGYGITFLRRGSSPGALLKIQGMGLNQPFAPGDAFTGWFESGDALLQLASGSAATGTACLRVSLQAQATFRESPVEVPVVPIAILGTLVGGVPTFVSQVEDVVPSGAASGVTGAFNISGWRRILVLVDTGGTDTTSFQLNPFFQVAGGTLWFDQGGTELVTVPNSNPGGGRYRMVSIALGQAPGSMYLAIRNLLPDGQTTLGLCVLGVE